MFRAYKQLLILLTFLTAISLAQAEIYLGGHYGLAAYRSAPLDRLKVSPNGSGFELYGGLKFSMLGVEGIYGKVSAEGDIVHDGTDYKIIEDLSYFSLALRASMQILYFRAGYGLYSCKSYFNRQGSELMNQIYHAYPDGKSAGGFLLGGGMRLPLGRAMGVYLDYTGHIIPSLEANLHSLSFGLIIYMSDSFLKKL